MTIVGWLHCLTRFGNADEKQLQILRLRLRMTVALANSTLHASLNAGDGHGASRPGRFVPVCCAISLIPFLVLIGVAV
jgi:hypothetical protein